MLKFKELLEAQKMIQYPDVNKFTDMFLKKVQKLMRSKGYKYKASKASAGIDWEWSLKKERIGFSGWHGTGSYGKLKIIMAMFKNWDDIDIFVFSANKGSFMPGMPPSQEIQNIDDAINTEDTITKKEFKEYKINLEKAWNWIEKNS